MKIPYLLLGLLTVLGLGCGSAYRSETPEKKPAPAPTEPASFEKDLAVVEADEDAAQAEVDKWLAEILAVKGRAEAAGKTSRDEPFRAELWALDEKIEKRRKVVSDRYEALCAHYPKSPVARYAYGNFLSDFESVEGSHSAAEQMEKAVALDPNHAYALNHLGIYYGHNGEIEKAFAFHEKAVELMPDEWVFVRNLALVTYTYRSDAKDRYKIDEQQCFDKALELYERALKLDPANAELAVDIATTYIGIQPLRLPQAMAASERAVGLVPTDLEKEKIWLNMARFQWKSGNFAEARKYVNKVTSPENAESKRRVTRAIDDAEKKGGTPPSP